MIGTWRILRNNWGHQMSIDDGFLTNEIFEIVLENTPLVSVDIILENEKTNLLGRRRNQPAKGFWFVPGGRIRKGELIIDALKRVALEEVGLVINIIITTFSEHLTIFTRIVFSLQKQDPRRLITLP